MRASVGTDCDSHVLPMAWTTPLVSPISTMPEGAIDGGATNASVPDTLHTLPPPEDTQWTALSVCSQTRQPHTVVFIGSPNPQRTPPNTMEDPSVTGVDAMAALMAYFQDTAAVLQSTAYK